MLVGYAAAYYILNMNENTKTHIGAKF